MSITTTLRGLPMAEMSFEITGELEEFINAVNKMQSGSQPFGQWAAQGRLRKLAKAISEFADKVDAAGYEPSALRAEAERYERLSKSVGDRELMTAYMAKAKALRKQLAA